MTVWITAAAGDNSLGLVKSWVLKCERGDVKDLSVQVDICFLFLHCLSSFDRCFVPDCSSNSISYSWINALVREKATALQSFTVFQLISGLCCSWGSLVWEKASQGCGRKMYDYQQTFSLSLASPTPCWSLPRIVQNSWKCKTTEVRQNASVKEWIKSSNRWMMIGCTFSVMHWCWQLNLPKTYSSPLKSIQI